MKYLTLVTLCFALLLHCVRSQQYFFSGQFPPGSGFNALSQAGARDPRQNRGPVVFPPSPPDAVDETSGVVVGASGFGFVPPQQTSQSYYTDDPASYVAYNYFTSPYTQRFSFF